MAGNNYATPSASRSDGTINSKVSAGSAKSVGSGHNSGQKNGGTGQTGSTTAGMHKTSTGSGHNKGQKDGGTNGKGHRSSTFASGGIINGKV